MSSNPSPTTVPFETVKLSHFAQRHLDSISPRDQNTPDSSLNLAGNASAIFHPFIRLPQELQDKVWNLYILSNPSIIVVPTTPRPRMREVVTYRPCPLLNVSTSIRAHASSEYGFSAFKTNLFTNTTLDKSAAEYAHTVNFNPSVDMLFLTSQYQSYYGTEIRTDLSSALMRDRIRSLAITHKDTRNTKSYVRRLFPKLSGLELVFVVIAEWDPSRRFVDHSYEVDEKLTMEFRYESVNKYFRRVKDQNLWRGLFAVWGLLGLWREKQGFEKPVPRIEFVGMDSVEDGLNESD